MSNKTFALAKTIYVFIIGMASLLNYSCKSTDKMPVDQELEKLAGKATQPRVVSIMAESAWVLLASSSQG